MQAVIIAKGKGYQDDKTFEPYEIVRHPCPKREDRQTFSYAGHYEPTPQEAPPPGSVRVTHESHSVALAKAKGERRSSYSYILLEHGGGRRVIAVHTSDDWRAAIMALPERMAYEVLRTTAALAEESDHTARAETAMTWRAAFVHGRIKKHRASRGTVRVELLPWYDAKTPGLNRARETGEVFEMAPGVAGAECDAAPGFYFYRKAAKSPAYGPYPTREAAQAAQGPSAVRTAVIPLASDEPVTHF